MKVLVDTSSWRKHLRAVDERLVDLLRERRVVVHEMVVHELVLGGVSAGVRRSLLALPHLPTARGDEILMCIDGYRLAQTGIGAVDTHLFHAALRASAALYTADSALAGAFGTYQPKEWR